MADAEKFAKKATELDSGYGKAFLLLGDLYIKRKNPKAALNALRTARSFSDLEVSALQSELNLWLQQENWTEALATLEMLLQLDSDTNWQGLIGSITEFVRQ